MIIISVDDSNKTKQTSDVVQAVQAFCFQLKGHLSLSSSDFTLEISGIVSSAIRETVSLQELELPR